MEKHFGFEIREAYKSTDKSISFKLGDMVKCKNQTIWVNGKVEFQIMMIIQTKIGFIAMGDLDQLAYLDQLEKIEKVSLDV